ncbi:hypothetical protein TPA0909_22860 [Streptomyces albus]|nr:hypothetical protein TPA0909_22860 [Streptomyces albus]
MRLQAGLGHQDRQIRLLGDVTESDHTDSHPALPRRRNVDRACAAYVRRTGHRAALPLRYAPGRRRRTCGVRSWQGMREGAGERWLGSAGTYGRLPGGWPLAALGGRMTGWFRKTDKQTPDPL